MSLFENFGADFSPCRTWRYRLWREWNPALLKACFVLMNPSKADEVNDDPTVARCQRRVAHWTGRSIGGVVVVNVFAWRETDSKKLPGIIAAGNDIVGPGNDAAILSAAKEADIVVCGWGIPGNLNGRGRAVEKMLRDAGITLHHLRLNSDGSPQHPLYIGYAVQPQEWPAQTGNVTPMPANKEG